MRACLFFYRGYLQALFFISLVTYVWFFSEQLIEGTLLDSVSDVIGIGGLIVGVLLRIWAVSHPGKQTRSRTIKASHLITTGPYSVLRNPIYLANFIIGLSFVTLAEAFLWVPLYILIFAISYHLIVFQEEEFLRSKFGYQFEQYCAQVPKWFPQFKTIPHLLEFGNNFHPKELGTTIGVVIGAFFIEWIDSPVHRAWINSLYHLLQHGSA